MRKRSVYFARTTINPNAIKLNDGTNFVVLRRKDFPWWFRVVQRKLHGFERFDPPR